MPRDETWDTGARSFLLSVVRSHAISVVVEWDFFFVWSCLVIKAGFFFFLGSVWAEGGYYTSG